ncbi:single-stranded DNA-binding protein [Calidifontibacillus erzurumensis]|uniref:Single-stranded DNA-binding protein n=1 Tax=Calidifontibacillus erzurumensis TaxID=2741433 RepID=A0A8J8GDY0_9BACI|nr:single-stranded DNA-binding protein [Calidifontibacillus erzurumensis]NSL51749.1 single-stranded DNA-binding protein [Calidifontibacillus erzurumensis]
MFNQVTLVGRMARDPELRFTGDGIPVANFTLALNRNYKNTNGEYDADFINCHVWRRQAVTLANYCLKGSLIGITGRLQSRHYDNSEGQRVYVTEVVAEEIKFINIKNNIQNQKAEIIKISQEEETIKD